MPEKSDPGAGHAMFGQIASSGNVPPETPATPPGRQSIPSSAPPAAAPPTGWFASKVVPVLVVLLLAAAAINLYLTVSGLKQLRDIAGSHADDINLLNRRMNTSDERFAQLSGKFQVTTERLGLTQKELTRARTLASSMQKQQQDAVQKLNAAIAQKAGTDEVNKLQADANTKFGAVSNDIDGLNKKLSETNDALSGTKGELTGAIARTHDELVELAHKTDRDYFEFALAHKGAKQKVGGVTVELSKTNPKRNLFTVNLYFDDKRTVRKDKAIDEPLYFYMQGAPNALELVVNKVGKDSIGGYLSAPKGFIANAPSVLAARPTS